MTPDAPLDLTPLAGFLDGRYGLAVQALGGSAVETAVAGRLRALGLGRVEAYARRVESDPEEERLLLEAVLVPETWFLRDREPFALLAALARKHLSAHPGQIFRVFSVACATGEEPYSAVLSLLEAGLPPERIAVRAVDASRKALHAAKAGVYSAASFREPSFARLRETYFRAQGENFALSPEVRRLADFVQANIAAPDFGLDEAPCQAVFCRNVLIYMTDPGRMRLLEGLNRLLAPEGVIFCGHSEATFLTRHGFAPYGPPQAFACRRRNERLQDAREAVPFRFMPLSAQPPAKAKPAPERKAAPGSPADPAAAPAPRLIAPAPTPSAPQAASPAASLAAPAAAAAATSSSASQPGYLAQARALADQGDIAQALDLCQRHIAAYPPEAAAYYLAGLLHQAANRPAEAENFYRKAVFLDPGHYEALIHLSLLRQAGGDQTQAALYRDRAERLKRRDQTTPGAGS